MQPEIHQQEVRRLGQPGAVGEHVAHGDRGRVLGGEVIQIIRNRHIEIDQALLTKLHDGGRGRRLADGRPVIDSVWRGRDTSGAVRQAKPFLVNNIFSQRDRDRQSRRSGPDKAVDVGLKLFHSGWQGDLTGERESLYRHQRVLGRVCD